jgi:hypothetical protein
MANVKISELTAASTPLAGTEVLPIVQSGGTVKASIANVQTAVYPGGTANGVAFLNGSKVLTTGTALAFDGIKLEVASATGSASPTPTEARIATTTAAASDWSTTLPWGRLSFYNSDASGFGPKIHAAIDAIAANTSGSASEMIFSINQAASNTLTERMRITSAGDVGIGTSSPTAQLEVDGECKLGDSTNPIRITATSATGLIEFSSSATGRLRTLGAVPLTFEINSTEAMRITSDGDLLVGKTATSLTVTGSQLNEDGTIYSVVTTGAAAGVYVNRQADDGVLISLRQANTQEGNISVAGTTVSYNGGHLSRWAQTTTAKDDTLVKGTVLSNLDEMNVYTDAEGNPVANEQLNKVKVSDVEGDANVAGVFVNWTHDEQHNVDEINMAMTGDMIIRIAQGTTVVRGDLLMSAGDGTAKPQGDDIVRSKTVAKVTSNHVTCTYADGSYCVPCVLMAC